MSGNVYSKNDIKISGSNNTVTGLTEYVTGIKVSGSNKSTSPPRGVCCLYRWNTTLTTTSLGVAAEAAQEGSAPYQPRSRLPRQCKTSLSYHEKSDDRTYIGQGIFAEATIHFRDRVSNAGGGPTPITPPLSISPSSIRSAVSTGSKGKGLQPKGEGRVPWPGPSC